MTNYGRTTRYLDLLIKLSTNVNAFQVLCSFLDDRGRHSWLGDELRIELKAEMGELVIDEYVRKEASELIHIHFDGKKRFSEREKNILEGLIAQRTQCAKVEHHSCISWFCIIAVFKGTFKKTIGWSMVMNKFSIRLLVVVFIAYSFSRMSYWF